MQVFHTANAFKEAIATTKTIFVRCFIFFVFLCFCLRLSEYLYANTVPQIILIDFQLFTNFFYYFLIHFMDFIPFLRFFPLKIFLSFFGIYSNI